jgi:uncharacterized repeat protein (TIGR01451 family)
METRSKMIGLARLFGCLALGLALAIFLLAMGRTASAASPEKWRDTAPGAPQWAGARPASENLLDEPQLQVVVNETHDWVGGETLPDSTIVATVWRDGLPARAGTAQNGSESHWHIEFPDEKGQGLRTGDVVEVETSRGLTASIEIIPMVGMVDANADTASGQLVDVPFPADVQGEVWTEDGVAVGARTDGSGNFHIDFSPYDVLPGHMVFLSYVRPDGHLVGIVRHALQLKVQTGPDLVTGSTAAGVPVRATLNAGETVTTTSDAQGMFELQFASDMTISDTLHVWAGTQQADLVVPYVTAYLDDDANRVMGYAPPIPGLADNLNVCAGHDCQATSADPSGYFAVQFEWDVTPFDDITVYYVNLAGHEIQYGFGPVDMVVDKQAPIAQVVPGEEFSYVIRYGNKGSGPATDVVMTDTLPHGVIYHGDTSGVTPIIDPAHNTLVWRLGRLGGYRSRAFELRVLLDPAVPLPAPEFRNEVEVSDPHDRDPHNNYSSADVEAWGPRGDLWLQKRRHGGLPIAGEVVIYQLRYGNGGTRPVHNVVLTETLAPGTAFEASTFEPGIHGVAQEVGDHEIVWNIGLLPPSETLEFDLAVRIDPAVAPGTLLVNELRISEDPDPDSDNRDNSQRFTTVVEPAAADLWLDKTIEGDLSSMENEILYRIVFRNDGTLPAEGVMLTETMPVAMTHLWHSAGTIATLQDGAIVWRLGTVPPSSGGELWLGARLAGPVVEGTVLTNIAEISTHSPELDGSNNRMEAALGPPQVICVPWIGTEAHRVLSGVETTLKGTAKGYGLTTFEWDPGDGSPPITGAVHDPYAIEAIHAYNAPVGTVYVARLTVFGAFGWSGTDTYVVEVSSPIHGVQVDVAVDEGLWYLHKQAYRDRRRGLPFAEWQTSGYGVAETASAVQAFQVQGHRLGGDPSQDPYVEDVQRAWNALFTFSKLDAVTLQLAGDPDSDGDGAGIGLYDDHSHAIYEAGMAMMALASSGAPGEVARAGPPIYVRGETYYSIVQNMADWFAWGQNDPDSDTARGGWRYQPNSGDSDNSNTQFPVLGLAAAEDNWGMTVPAWVKDELRDYWLAYTQNDNGGFGYMAPDDWVNVGKTGACIMNLAWTGVPTSDSRIRRASQFIESHWNDAPDGEWNGNVGEFYAMYAVKKGSLLAGIDAYGPHFWDGEYSAYLVGAQQPDGRFDDAGNFGSWQPMATSWALMILSPGLYEPLPVAIISPIQYGATEPGWYEGQVQFDGTASHHTDPERELVLFEWDFGDGGTASSTLTPFHTYADNGVYTVTLTVTDDQDGADRDTLLLTVENVTPEVAAGADQIVSEDDVVSLDPATFIDPGLADTHTATVDWGDGTVEAAVVNQEAHTVSASHVYTAPGTYTVTVSVTDDDGGTGSDTFTVTVGRVYLYLPVIMKGSQ